MAKNQNSNQKVHFKMYKAGRQWLVAGIALAAMGFILQQPASASASTDTSDQNTPAVVQEKPATKDNVSVVDQSTSSTAVSSVDSSEPTKLADDNAQSSGSSSAAASVESSGNSDNLQAAAGTGEPTEDSAKANSAIVVDKGDSNEPDVNDSASDASTNDTTGKTTVPTKAKAPAKAVKTTVVPAANPESDFTVVDGSITGFNGNKDTTTTIVIPDTINGADVTSINSDVFSFMAALTSVTIPEGVTSIGSSAFYNDAALVQVNLPTTLTAIGNGAFDSDGLTSIILPDSVKTIGDYAFRHNHLSGILNLPAQMSSIGTGAFSNNLISSLTLPNDLQKIGAHAFENNRLSNAPGEIFYIPASVTTIGDNAFANNRLVGAELLGTPINAGTGIFALNGLQYLASPIPLYGNIQIPGYFAMPVNATINLDGYLSYIFNGDNELLGDVTNVTGGVTFKNNSFTLPIGADGSTVSGFSFTATYADSTGVQFQRDIYVGLTNILAHNSTIYTNDTWKGADNFDSASQGYYGDADPATGEIPLITDPIDFNSITVYGTVDTSTPGDYTIYYIYGYEVKSITVTVVSNQTDIKVEDSTLYIGDDWQSADNFISATDKNGNQIDLVDVTVKGTVDTTQVGVYEVTYTYGGKTATAKITVVKNQTSINIKDSTIYAGDKWNAKDTFVNATDEDGNAVDFDDVKVTGSVDTSKAGVYEVTYSYNSVFAVARITVRDDQGTIDTHDSTIHVGDKWNAEDNFDGAVDKAGQPLHFSDLKVSGTVNTDKAGVYEVTYSYNGVKSTAKITVLDNKTSVNAKNSTLYVGDEWNAKDTFVNATDKDGHQIDFTKVKVTGSVDTSKAGVYEVTYSYNGVSAVARVTVRDNQATIDAHDSTIHVGDKWNAEDNFDSAVDKAGQPLHFSNLKVSEMVNTDKAGVYKVIYSYGDSSKTVYVTVLPAENHGALTGKDQTGYVGDKVPDGSQFVGSVLDENGKPVDASQVKVDLSKVNNKQAGNYVVTLTYTDGQGIVHQATATYHVLADQSDLQAHDVTMTLGDKHPTAQSFVSVAKDRDGNDISANAVADFSQVDWDMAGDYEVTITDEGQTTTVILHIVGRDAGETPETPSTPTPSEKPVTKPTSEVKKVTTTKLVDLPNTKVSKTQMVKANQTKAKKLPQTDEQAGWMLMLSGLAALFGIGFGLKRKKQID